MSSQGILHPIISRELNLLSQPNTLLYDCTSESSNTCASSKSSLRRSPPTKVILIAPWRMSGLTTLSHITGRAFSRLPLATTPAYAAAAARPKAAITVKACEVCEALLADETPPKPPPAPAAAPALIAEITEPAAFCEAWMAISCKSTGLQHGGWGSQSGHLC